MESISEGRQYLLHRERKIGKQETTLLQPDTRDQSSDQPVGLGNTVGGREGFTNFMGPTAVTAMNRKDAQAVQAMEDDFNSSLSKFARTQAQLMDDTRQFVGVTAPGQNRYARKIVKFRNGWVGYVSRYGEVSLLPIRPGGGDGEIAEWAKSYVSNMEARPGCGGYARTIPADFPAASATELPPRGTPIKVDGMTGKLFYGGELPVAKPKNKAGIPCGMEGYNIQATMMGNAEEMWDATSKGKRVHDLWQEQGGTGVAKAGIYSEKRGRPSGGGAFIGCVRQGNSPQLGAGANLEKQDDLGEVDRFACFTRAVDLGAQAYGLANARKEGESVKGTCYVTRDGSVDVTQACSAPDSDGATKCYGNCTERTSGYRHATQRRTVKVVISQAPNPIKREDVDRTAYGVSFRGELLGWNTQEVWEEHRGAGWPYLNELLAAYQKERERILAAEAEALYGPGGSVRDVRGGIQSDLNYAQNQVASATSAERAAKARIEEDGRTMQADRDALRRAGKSGDPKAALLALGNLIEDATNLQSIDQRAAKDAASAEARVEKEAKKVSDYRAQEAKLRKETAIALDGAKEDFLNQVVQYASKLPVGRDAAYGAKLFGASGPKTVSYADLMDCLSTGSGSVATCPRTVLMLDNSGNIFLATSKNGVISNKTLVWASPVPVEGIRIPELAECSVLGTMDTGGDGYVLQAGGKPLASPDATCRLVVGSAPANTVPQPPIEVPEHKDANGNWVAAHQEEQQPLPDWSGPYNVYLELEWFESACRGLRDVDDATYGDALEEGQAGGTSETSVALHLTPGLPESPWQNETPAQLAYYVHGAASPRCLETGKPMSVKRPHASPPLGNAYSKIGGYDSPGHDIPGAYMEGVKAEQCEAACNERSDCAGFVFADEGGQCYPKTAEMFPKGLRKPYAASDIYVRHVKPRFDSGSICPTDVQASTVYQLGSFPTGAPVTPDMPCDLAEAVACDRAPIQKATAELNKKRNAMLEKVRDLGRKDSRLVAELGYNVDRLKNDIDAYSQTVKGSGALGGGAMVGPQAYQEDTDLVMIQENYRYLLWTITAVVAVGVGIKLGRN